jgi:[ribosomal protein S18]-alanine N-acetyltransferase
MSAGIEVRKFRAAELERILEIEHSSFGKDAYDRNLFAGFFHKCGDLFLVAARRGKICGYSITCMRGERAELVSVAVDPAERGRGAGSALLASTLRRLRRRGAGRLVLMVRPANAAALAFYEKFGFRPLRTVRKYYEDGEDGLLMTKPLA